MKLTIAMASLTFSFASGIIFSLGSEAATTCNDPSKCIGAARILPKSPEALENWRLNALWAAAACGGNNQIWPGRWRLSITAQARQAKLVSTPLAAAIESALAPGGSKRQHHKPKCPVAGQPQRLPTSWLNDPATRRHCAAR